MGFETMGGMKVLALKGIEKQGHSSNAASMRRVFLWNFDV
jgi:hypothetical protein